MDNRLLLVKSITLLYRESEIENQTEKSSGIVRNIVAMIKSPDSNLTLDPTSIIIDELKKLALSMTEDPLGYEYSSVDLLQRLEVIAKEDPTLVKSIASGISEELSQQKIKRQCLNLRRSLTNYFREETAKKIMSDALNKLRYERAGVENFNTFMQELLAGLEPYQQDAVISDPAIVGRVNLEHLEAMAEVYKQIQDEADGSMKLVTGWQAVNRMLDGGFRRGEEVVVGALQHNYKTGFSLSVFKQLALYNDPKLYDTTKKPLLLRISFEDDLILNFQFLYCSLRQNEGFPWPSREELLALDSMEVARYVQEKLTARGWHIEMLRVDPTRWTYLDLCNKIMEYEADGYEVCVCMVDYLKMIPTTGCTQGPTGSDIRDMFRRMRNFTSPRKITFVTPHQLSTQAKDLVRQGIPDFVKFIANKGYFDGCRTLDNEVDLELYIHIEKHATGSYLTVQRGKHRKIGQTPDEDLYTVLPFTKGGCILDDINTDDSARRKVGAGPIGSDSEKPHWCLDNEF